MATRHGFCGLHKIGYDRTLDAHCPQCILGRIYPTKQYDYDAVAGKPLDDHGSPIEPLATQASP
jgi:hypothetical protein